MRINLEFNTADLIAVIVLLCLLGLAVKIIIGFFKENPTIRAPAKRIR